MTTDATAIPENENQVMEYLDAMEQAHNNNDATTEEPLARALAQSNAATDDVRGRAGLYLGQILEAQGKIDDAIDAFRVADLYHNAEGTTAYQRLKNSEQVGPLGAARTPQNEAEADWYWEGGVAAYKNKDYERAYQLLRALHDSKMNNAAQEGQAAYALGLALQKSGDNDASAYYFREASELGGDGAEQKAREKLGEYAAADGLSDAGLDHAASMPLNNANDVATLIQAAIDRYDNGDQPGAESRFTAVHSSQVASDEQRRYAAYYLATLAWHANNYDVARTYYREARQSPDNETASRAAAMLRQHWNEQ